MTDVTTERERSADLPSAPSDTPASPPADNDLDLEALLREFDEKTQTPAPESDITDGNVANGLDQSVDEQLTDLLRSPEDKQHIDELTQQIEGFRTAEHRRAELEAF